jgi:hypothetical protein
MERLRKITTISVMICIWVSHSGDYGEFFLQSHNAALLAACFMPGSCLVYSFSVKMEAMRFSNTAVDFHWTAWSCIPADRTLLSNGNQSLGRDLNLWTHEYEPQTGIELCVAELLVVISFSNSRSINSPFNFNSIFVWVCVLVSHIEGRT